MPSAVTLRCPKPVLHLPPLSSIPAPPIFKKCLLHSSSQNLTFFFGQNLGTTWFFSPDFVKPVYSKLTVSSKTDAVPSPLAPSLSLGLRLLNKALSISAFLPLRQQPEQSFVDADQSARAFPLALSRKPAHAYSGHLMRSPSLSLVSSACLPLSLVSPTVPEALNSRILLPQKFCIC